MSPLEKGIFKQAWQILFLMKEYPLYGSQSHVKVLEFHLYPFRQRQEVRKLGFIVSA